MPLTPDQETTYTAVIDGILASADLDTISAKAIRRGLQAAVQFDVSNEKEAVNTLIMARFDRMHAMRGKAQAKKPKPPPLTNGHKTPQQETLEESSASPPAHKRQSNSEDLSDVAEAPPRKKNKVNAAEEDAKLAARLQAEENGLARPTRGGGSRKRAPVKKSTPRKKAKSVAKIKGSDDSDAGSSSEEKPVKRSGAFHKPMNLSMPLSHLLGGETTLSRPQTVKKIWDYVKARDLQDPDDKRQIRCDEALRAVFKQDRVHMFTMNKILSTHLYPADD